MVGGIGRRAHTSPVYDVIANHLACHIRSEDQILLLPPSLHKVSVLHLNMRLDLISKACAADRILDGVFNNIYLGNDSRNCVISVFDQRESQ